MKNQIIYGFILLVLFLPFASTHLDGGEHREVGEYNIGFSYSPSEPKQIDNVLLLFELEKREVLIDFSHVELKISQGEEILFAGKLYSEEMYAQMAYKFSNPGTYKLEAKFFEGGEQLVKTDFNLKVKRHILTNVFNIILGLIIIAFLLTYPYKRKRN